MNELQQMLEQFEQAIQEVSYAVKSQLNYLQENAENFKEELQDEYNEQMNQINEKLSTVESIFKGMEKTVNDYVDSITPEILNKDLKKLQNEVERDVSNFQDSLERKFRQAEREIKFETAEAKAKFKLFEAKIKLKTAANNFENSMNTFKENFNEQLNHAFGEL